MVSYTNILAKALLPPFWLICSAAAFGIALFAPQRWWRIWPISLFLVFCLLSFTTSKTHFWFWPGLSNLWNQSILVYIVHILTLLHDDRFAPEKTSPSWKNASRWLSWIQKIRTVYKLSWNPRRIPISAGEQKMGSKDHGTSKLKYLSFYILSFVKLAIYYQVHYKLLPPIFDEVIVEIQPQDVSPAQEILFLQLSEMTAREALVRAYVSTYWIWESIVYTDGAHTMLAILFVSIGLDTPQEWPSLYGNPSQARSMRGFWTQFWHTIVVRPYKSFGAGFTKNMLGVSSSSPWYSTTVALTVFGLSGLSHAIVAWYAGHESWDRNIHWFLLNFVACAAETLVLTAIQRARKSSRWLHELLRIVETSWMGTLIGHAWVCTFMFMTVPLWKYPAEYKQAVAMENIKRIFSGMSVVSG